MSLALLELLLTLSMAIALSALIGVCIIMKKLHDAGILDGTPPAARQEIRTPKKSILRF